MATTAFLRGARVTGPDERPPTTSRAHGDCSEKLSGAPADGRRAETDATARQSWLPVLGSAALAAVLLTLLIVAKYAP